MHQGLPLVCFRVSGLLVLSDTLPHGSVLRLCGKHILGARWRPGLLALRYLLERAMHRHRFRFPVGKHTPQTQTTLSHPCTSFQIRVNLLYFERWERCRSPLFNKLFSPRISLLCLAPSVSYVISGHQSFSASLEIMPRACQGEESGRAASIQLSQLSQQHHSPTPHPIQWPD